MSTGSAHPPSLPSPTNDNNAIENAHFGRRLSFLSLPGNFDFDPDLPSLEDVFCESPDYMVEEDTRGDPPPNTVMDGTTADVGDHQHYDLRVATTTTPTTTSITTTTSPGMNYNDNLTPTTALEHQEHDDSNASFSLPPLPDHDDSSLDLLSNEDEQCDRDHVENQTFLEENEMRRKLMDMESSFLPEPSTIEVAASTGSNKGADNTFLVGMSHEHAPESTQPSWMGVDEPSHNITSIDEGVRIARSPSIGPTEDLDATPAALSRRYGDTTTMLETLPSSPTAAAAARMEIRNQSALPDDVDETSLASQDYSIDQSSILSVNHSLEPTHQQARHTPPTSISSTMRLFHDNSGSDADASSRTSSRRGSRPRYLMSRQSAHRLSHSSATSNATEVTQSDATLGADYALQSGGATPGNRSLNPSGSRNNLARSVSLGSMASGISGYSDEHFMDKRTTSGTTDSGLQTLDEEEGSRPGSSQQQQQQQSGHEQEREPPPPQPAVEDVLAPTTPKAKPHDHSFPTDTVIAERIKDVQVPSTFVKQFREDFGGPGLSPDKRMGVTPGFAKSGRSMTLKEQSSTIDRLSKENFDLKMRIHFLNEALNRRSEEGIKEMISENVELKSDKLKLQKENQGLKRKVRDLEKQVKEQQSDKESMLNHDPAGSDEEDRDAAQDEELLFLRERVETFELEIERLRSESIARESEKRKLAEMVKSLSDGRPMGSDTGAREERDMWKDMLDAEAAAREQAQEENKALRDEIIHLKNEMSFAVAPVRTGRRDRVGSMASYSAPSEKDFHRTTATGSSASSTLIMEFELLKQENAELRKEVSAQTSMLTSRNREKERLYQEIEELKLGQRRDGTGRSIAGDSILDRSASRAHGRSSSRTSDLTGQSPIDDPEREDLEVRNGQLRDQVSSLKLENQAIRTQLDDCARDLEALDKAYQADVDQAEEEIQNLQQERDQALQMAEERDAAFQDLRAEAQEELDALGDELDQKIEECQRLGEEIRNQDENLRALQAEMRSAGEGIIRLEEDAQNNLQRYKAVQQELEDCNREMESLEKSLYEANTKVQRLTVQIESSHNEIAFLREEQDGDKIKIGDLESELKTYRMSLQSEKDKARELEERLADERHQREVVGSKEKQEVQRIMNELNREASTAKEEARRLKKSLSAQEIETATWKERLTDLENNLRETLGDLTGSRSSLISNIMKLQKELESTALELESVRSALDEKESLLRNRDALLESHGLESRKLAELLERERHARRADKQSFEQALKSHHQASRTITQNNSRISELESARSQDRKRFTSLEQQFRDQLNERNSMLLTIWKRLSAMCGPDWAHSNSLINGNLPSQEVIGNILFWPVFSRNLLLAVKTLESVIGGFKNRIKGVERDLTKQYQTLEHAFGLRIKKLDRLEESMMNIRAQQQSRIQSGMSPEIAKLRGENRLLKAELNLIQTHSRGRGVTADVTGSPRSLTHNLDTDRSSLIRHNSDQSKGLTRNSGLPQPSQVSSTTTLVEGGAVVHNSKSRQRLGPHDPSNEVWIKRLNELEKRLKAEREGRLLDRSGARKRLAERDAENQQLRAQLERERIRKGLSTETSTDDQTIGDEEYQSHRDDDPSSSEGEGITVDIEV